MENFLLVLLIIVSIAIVALILTQQGGSGAGSVFGGGGGGGDVYRSRRGLEKIFHRLTIFLVFLYSLIAVVLVFV